MNPQKMTIITIALVLIVHLPTFGATLYPNDDLTIRNSANKNASSPFGLFVKNSSDVSYMEYTLGNIVATEAKLVLHNDDAGVTSPWTIVLKGSEFSFDETTFNDTFAGSAWSQVGTIPNVKAIAFYEMDMTAWYNDNLGKTMSLFMTRDAQPGGSGPIFEDSEGTKTGDALTYGPRLEVTAAPAKATNPNPPNGASPIHPDPILTWNAPGEAISHDVYFDTTDPPAFKINQGDTTYDPGLLDYDITYYWRIDEVTGGGAITGDVWSFMTAIAGDLDLDDDVDNGDLAGLLDYWLDSGCDSADQWCQWCDIIFSGSVDGIDYAKLAANWWYGVPDRSGQASNPNPADTATDVGIASHLRWTAGPDTDSHDVYFGTSNPPAFQANQPGEAYYPGTMSENTTYYWRIDEINSTSTTTGTVWCFTTGTASSMHDIIFPGTTWQTKSPAELGLNSTKLDQFASNVGGVGCIVRQGHVVKTWGSQNAKADWASAAKPVISTMLFFAVEENLLTDVHELIEDHGWDLVTKDEPMEFYHLANMTSGYARGEAPGSAWAYNDYAIKLYAKTLFDNVYGTTANTAVTDPDRLDALQFEDGSIFSSRNGYGVSTSVRDFARIGWFWCNYGYWSGRQLLPRWYFDDYMKAHVPSHLPRTTSGGSDYLGVDTYGGGSDQAGDGPGVYGFNWWCNPNRSNWPDAPADTIQANGHWGQEVVTVIPSLSLVVACRGNMGSHTTGSSGSAMNQNLKLLVEACPEFPLGQIMVDDANPGRMLYHAYYENGREKPVCFVGPGDPEDFFYNDTTNNLNLLIDRGARCTYITALLQDFGGGNPGTGSAFDAKLEEWEGYITQLEDAGIITIFFFFDDSQSLTGNWEELVDKCVAKFKHHKLLIWSVAEEYSEALTQTQASQVAARIKQQDNYDHIVGIHQLGGNNFDFLTDSNYWRKI